MAKKKQVTKRNIEVENMSVTDFFNTKYLDYGKYVAHERALPSIVDGFKPGARKIMHAALHLLTETKKSKYIDLIGTTMSYSKYHHGDSSLEGTILTLSKHYSDNLAPFRVVGSGGDLRSRESAAARYLDIKLSEFAKIFKKDQEIFEYNYDGDSRVEPKVYLPIIPTLLTSRTTGVSLGFKYGLYCSYNPVSIIECCLDALKNGELTKPLIPHINEFNGSFENHSGRIYAKGIWRQVKNKIIINEFAPNETFESFEKNLNKLIDTGKIVRWINESVDDNIEYHVTVKSEFNDRLKDDLRIERELKISEFLKKSTLTVLDENQKIVEFSSVENILEYFVEYRLTRYSESKQYLIDTYEGIIKEKTDLQKFIDLYLTGKIKFNNKTSLSDTRKKIESYHLSGDFVSTRLSKLTKDEYDKLGAEIKELQDKLDYTIKTSPAKMYENDLKDLHKTFKNTFKMSPYKEI